MDLCCLLRLSAPRVDSPSNLYCLATILPLQNVLEAERNPFELKWRIAVFICRIKNRLQQWGASVPSPLEPEMGYSCESPAQCPRLIWQVGSARRLQIIHLVRS
jgi:hypothetical protein